MVLSKCRPEITVRWIAAEGALEHARRNSTSIYEVLHDSGISKSDYVVLAGFDELLIKSGVGHLEQIHIFVSTEVNASSFSKLGQICSPFSSRLFTNSSSYLLPVYKDDETVLEFDELVRRTALKFDDGGSTGKPPMTVMNSSPTGGQGGSGQGIGGGGQGSGGGGQGSGGGGQGSGGDGNDPSIFGGGGEGDGPGGGGGGPGGGGGIDMREPKEIFFHIYTELDGQVSQTLSTEGCLTIQVLFISAWL